MKGAGSMGEGQTMGALGVYGETAYLESACSVADLWIIALFGMEPMEENITVLGTG